VSQPEPKVAPVKVEVKQTAIVEKPVQSNEATTTIELSKHNSKDISVASKFIT
jgi:hypothetical protein